MGEGRGGGEREGGREGEEGRGRERGRGRKVKVRKEGRREGGREGGQEEVKLMNDVYLKWYLIFETSIGSCFEERFSSYDISTLSTEEES